MAQKKDSGVFQTEKGLWGYRFTLLIEGKRISRRKFTDSDGNKLTSKKQAVRAREEVIIQAHLDEERKRLIILPQSHHRIRTMCSSHKDARRSLP